MYVQDISHVLPVFVTLKLTFLRKWLVRDN